MFWLKQVLDSAAEIQPDKLIDSDEPVHAGEIILGIAHDEMKQLHTCIRLAEIELNKLIDEARDLSRVDRKKKFDEMFQAGSRIEILEVLFSKELQRRFNVQRGSIEIRSGFQVVWCKGFFRDQQDREDA